MISVVIPLYNKEQSITDTVNSVLNQTYSGFELVIVNDGSTDNSLAVLEPIEDKRLRVISKANGGVSSARNVGILASNNNYVAFLDGDDIWYPNHLEVLVNAIKQYNTPEIGGYATKYIKSSSKEFIAVDNGEPYVIDNYIKEATSRDKVICSSNFVARRDYMIEVGLFNESYAYGEDVDLWFRLFKKFKLVSIPTVTAIYFLAAENRSVTKIMPLEKRFYNFDYNSADKIDIKYFDKLVSIIVLDYFMQGGYKICMKVLSENVARLPYILNYYAKLVIKKLGADKSVYV